MKHVSYHVGSLSPRRRKGTNVPVKVKSALLPFRAIFLSQFSLSVKSKDTTTSQLSYSPIPQLLLLLPLIRGALRRTRLGPQKRTFNTILPVLLPLQVLARFSRLLLLPHRLELLPLPLQLGQVLCARSFRVRFGDERFSILGCRVGLSGGVSQELTWMVNMRL